jgi:hypothetical protein
MRRSGTSSESKAPPTVSAPVVAAPSQRGVPAGWIGDVEGFRVDGPDGRIGTVAHVVREAPADVPVALDVATGLFIVHVEHIPIRDVIEVQPSRRRLAVRSVPYRPRLSRHHLHRGVRRFLRSAARTQQR